jgi:hypothetical protein
MTDRIIFIIGFPPVNENLMLSAAYGQFNPTREGCGLLLFAPSAKSNKKKFSANFAPRMSAANGR